MLSAVTDYTSVPLSRADVDVDVDERVGSAVWWRSS